MLGSVSFPTVTAKVIVGAQEGVVDENIVNLPFHSDLHDFYYTSVYVGSLGILHHPFVFLKLILFSFPLLMTFSLKIIGGPRGLSSFNGCIVLSWRVVGILVVIIITSFCVNPSIQMIGLNPGISRLLKW